MPSLICSLKGHRPGGPTIANQGRTFGRCARCGADLLEVDGGWRTAPKGMRIVWAASRPTATGEAGADEATASEPRERSAGDRRTSEDRRKTKSGSLPAFLRGKDRRSGQRDRRHAFGRRFRGE